MLHVSMIKVSVGPSQFDFFFKMGLLKIQNLEHKYRTTKAQFPRKVDGA
jgi:hypothetical protein